MSGQSHGFKFVVRVPSINLQQLEHLIDRMQFSICFENFITCVPANRNLFTCSSMKLRLNICNKTSLRKFRAPRFHLARKVRKPFYRII